MYDSIRLNHVCTCTGGSASDSTSSSSSDFEDELRFNGIEGSK